MGGPAKGCKMRRRKVDEAGEGGGLLVAAIRKPEPSSAGDERQQESGNSCDLPRSDRSRSCKMGQIHVIPIRAAPTAVHQISLSGAVTVVRHTKPSPVISAWTIGLR